MARIGLLSMLLAFLSIQQSQSQTCGFNTLKWIETAELCVSSLKVGDFNGDHRDDLLCTDTSSNTVIYLAERSGVYHAPSIALPAGFCTPGAISVGDFNGDSRSDLMCYDSATGEVSVIYFTQRNVFTDAKKIFYDPICSSADKGLEVGDFDGNGVSDLLCWEADSHVTIHFMFGFHRRAKRHAFPWHVPRLTISHGYCDGTNEDLVIADFNGDRRSDILCKDDTTGLKDLYLTNALGEVSQTAIVGAVVFCVSPDYLRFGDVDGDLRTDFICVADADGAVTIRYTSATGLPSVDSGTTFTTGCTVGSSSTSLASSTLDANGDGTADLFCYADSSGGANKNSIEYSECSP